MTPCAPSCTLRPTITTGFGSICLTTVHVRKRPDSCLSGTNPKPEQHIFVYLEWYPVPPDGYAVRNEFHFELTDEARAQVIKRAHDLDASIVEVHSHGGSWPAAFSPSDQWGFREFVPHVWWRLKGRPYLAVVATRHDFDGLVWITGPEGSSTSGWHRGRRADAHAYGNFVPHTGLLCIVNDMTGTFVFRERGAGSSGLSQRGRAGCRWLRDPRRTATGFAGCGPAGLD